jgi:hypothetical protein
MAAGGKRPGAGRKVGAIGKKTEELIAAVAATGETPLDYMLRVMRDPTVDHERRDRSANNAAPYCHSKLAQTDVNAQLNVDGSITFTWQPPQES